MNFLEIIKEGITIGGIHYKIELVDKHPNNSAMASVDYTRNVIIIENHEEQRIKECLLHEVVHILLYQSGNEEHDEREVIALSNWLLSALIQNKELFQAISY